MKQIANMSDVEWPENIEISDKASAEDWLHWAAQFTEEDRFHHALP